MMSWRSAVSAMLSTSPCSEHSKRTSWSAEAGRGVSSSEVEALLRDDVLRGHEDGALDDILEFATLPAQS